MSDYAVLLEEIADREAEARAVMHRASGPFQSWAVTLVVVPWTRERWLLMFDRLVGDVSLLPVVSDENDTCSSLPFFLFPPFLSLQIL